MKGWAYLALLALMVAPATSSGQELARQVSAVGDGTARLTYPTRPGVEICDQGIRMGQQRFTWHSRGEEGEPQNCRPGPVEIEISVRAGSVRDVDVVRRMGDRTAGAADLGSVTAEDAVAFLMETARHGGPSGIGVEEALFPMVLADVEEIWRDLLATAKDGALDEDVRTGALFWVGQEAADAVTAELGGVALDEDEDQDVREAAVFALSQRAPDEGVPMLMQVAKTAQHLETRRSAMFWLAQTEDDRVYAFFEEVLLGRGGG